MCASRVWLCSRQVFQVARRAGFAPDGVQLQHVPFGLVQGAVMKRKVPMYARVRADLRSSVKAPYCIVIAIEQEMTTGTVAVTSSASALS